MSGYENTLPKIKTLRFVRASIELLLEDGRIVSAPLNKFPAIKKLSAAQRKKYHIMGGVGFDFDDSDEVYHISEFLGADNSLVTIEKRIYSQQKLATLAAEARAEYRKGKTKPMRF